MDKNFNASLLGIATPCSQQISLNKLVEELSTAAIVEFDAYNRFLARAARGSVENGLNLLDGWVSQDRTFNEYSTG